MDGEALCELRVPTEDVSALLMMHGGQTEGWSRARCFRSFHRLSPSSPRLCKNRGAVSSYPAPSGPMGSDVPSSSTHSNAIVPVPLPDSSGRQSVLRVAEPSEVTSSAENDLCVL